MIWWLKTRQVWILVSSVVICAALLRVLQDAFVPVPVLFGSDGMALWSMFVPLLWAAAVAHCFVPKTQSLEVRPAHRLQIYDASLVVVAAACAGVVFAGLAGTYQSTVGAAGHILIMTGVACLGTLLGGPARGSLATVVLLLVTSFYSVRAPAGHYIRILQPDGNATWAFVIGVVACGVACLLILVGATRTELTNPHLRS